MVDWDRDGRNDLVVFLPCWRENKSGFQLFVNTNLDADFTIASDGIPVSHVTVENSDWLLSDVGTYDWLSEPELKIRDVNGDKFVDLLFSRPPSEADTNWRIVQFLNLRTKGSTQFAKPTVIHESEQPILGFDILATSGGQNRIVVLGASGFKASEIQN